jgi:hypothetical protein
MCDVSVTLPPFTAGRTNRVPLEFRDDSGSPIDLTGKTLRLRYWVAETEEFVFEDSVSDGDETGDVEFAHAIGAFDFTETTVMGWILDVLEGTGEEETVDPYASGTVTCYPVPPAPEASE